jgi:xanthine dehydrogenase accessory factor
MENLDVMVLRTLRDWRVAGKHALLATVVRTWGSSPRPVGSIMALCQDGAVVGSVSGGCIEDDLIHRFTQAYAPGSARSLPKGPPEWVKYGISADEAHRLGLPCGGTLELLLEFDPDAQGLAALVSQLDAGSLVQRSVNLLDGHAQLQACSAAADCHATGTHLVNTFGPEFRMLLIGAGPLTECLATMAIFCGFAVTVCDPREEYRGSWALGGVTMRTEMPDDVVLDMRPDRRTCVVALTHDPKLDDMALLEALKTEAFYIGAIGSRRNNEARQQRMIEHFDETAESLQRLRGPIGLYIASKTPPEIAVSIMGEILAVKNDVDLPLAMRVGPAKDGLAVAVNDPGIVVCGIA